MWIRMCAGHLNNKMLFMVLHAGLKVVTLQKYIITVKSTCQRFPEKIISFRSSSSSVLRVSSSVLDTTWGSAVSFDHCEFTYCVTGKYFLIPKQIMRLDVIPYVRSSLIQCNAHSSTSMLLTRCIHALALNYANVYLSKFAARTTTFLLAAKTGHLELWNITL